MIGVTIQCRLGNQLFQYAFIKALAKKLNTGFFLNENINEFLAAKYFDFRGLSKVRNRFNQLYFKITKSPFKPLNHLELSDFDVPQEEMKNLANNQIYSGYFQSEEYFKNICHNIQFHISVKKGYRNEFNQLYGNQFKKNKVIAIHIRKGDYLDLDSWWNDNLGSSNLSLPNSFYLDCLKKVEDIDRYQIVFVSDDIKKVKEDFKHMKNASFSENSLIIDFQIIMNADICIISNSSFSWWASYLNCKKNKQIFCPKYWLGFKIGKEYPNKIIPMSWNKVNVS